MILALLLALQTTPVAPIERGTGLPPPGTEEGAVMAPIAAAFAAFETGDGAALLRHVYPEGRVTAVGATANGTSGVRKQSFAEYAAKMTPGSGFQERVSSPAIEIDGDIAMVWAPFTVRRGGAVVSCGYDLFDLVREQGAWKIMNVTFSTRTGGCPAG
jgi:hypothetical protein